MAKKKIDYIIGEPIDVDSLIQNQGSYQEPFGESEEEKRRRRELEVLQQRSQEEAQPRSLWQRAGGFVRGVGRGVEETAKEIKAHPKESIISAGKGIRVGWNELADISGTLFNRAMEAGGNLLLPSDITESANKREEQILAESRQKTAQQQEEISQLPGRQKTIGKVGKFLGGNVPIMVALKGLPVPAVIEGASPLVRWAGSSAIRGTEFAGYGVLQDIADGKSTKETLKNIPRNLTVGALANTILSPRLAIQVAKDPLGKKAIRDLTSTEAKSIIDLLGGKEPPPAGAGTMTDITRVPAGTAEAALRPTVRPQPGFDITGREARPTVGLGAVQEAIRPGVKPGEVGGVGRPAEAIPTKVPSTILPVGEGATKTSRLAQRITSRLEGLDQQTKDALPTYNVMNKQDQIAAAADYVTRNPDEAMAVLKGDVAPPQGLLRNSIALALEEKATQDGDAEMARNLASLYSTRAGQEISILTERDPNSPVRYIADVQKARIEARGGQEAVTRSTTEETAKIQSEIARTTPNKQSWSDFIDSLRCGG